MPNPNTGVTVGSFTFAENLPRDQISTDLAASLATGVMTSVAMVLLDGDTVTGLSFLSGATALATPTHAWAALYSNATTPALLQQSADQPALAWAADTVITFTLAAPIQIKTTGIYWAALMIAATTPPTLVGKTLPAGRLVGHQNLIVAQAGTQPLAQSSGSALTTTAPATIVTPTAKVVIPYCFTT